MVLRVDGSVNSINFDLEEFIFSLNISKMRILLNELFVSGLELVEIDLKILIVSFKLSVLINDSLLIIDLTLLVIDNLFLISNLLS